MTRIVSYNILAGGYNIREAGTRRSAQLIKMLGAVQPDVVGVVEAIHPHALPLDSLELGVYFPRGEASRACVFSRPA